MKIKIENIDLNSTTIYTSDLFKNKKPFISLQVLKKIIIIYLPQL